MDANVKAWSDQANNTTGVYIDDLRVETFPGNHPLDEKRAKEAYAGEGARFFERLVFGDGRVALRFRSGN